MGQENPGNGTGRFGNRTRRVLGREMGEGVSRSYLWDPVLDRERPGFPHFLSTGKAHYLLKVHLAPLVSFGVDNNRNLEVSCFH